MESFRDLSMAFSLLRNSIHLGFIFLEYKGGMGEGPNATKAFNFYDSLGYNIERLRPISFNAETVAFVKSTFDKLQQVEDRDESITHAFKLYDNLHTVAYRSALYALGLFSLIECCLTHNPRGSEDSLSHQIRTKFTLISKRFCRPLEVSKWFGELSEKKVWSELYAYRSSIAHGTKYQFEQTYSKLGCKEDDAKEFLEEVAKLLLIACLDEPKLMMDLKQC
jgi:AraC-like DNA-binding protein